MIHDIETVSKQFYDFFQIFCNDPSEIKELLSVDIKEKTSGKYSW